MNYYIEYYETYENNKIVCKHESCAAIQVIMSLLYWVKSQTMSTHNYKDISPLSSLVKIWQILKQVQYSISYSKQNEDVDEISEE